MNASGVRSRETFLIGKALREVLHDSQRSQKAGSEWYKIYFFASMLRPFGAVVSHFGSRCDGQLLVYL